MYAQKPLFLLILVLLSVLIISKCGVVHQIPADLHKERESDGAFSPRDRGHFDSEGHHHQEFDHEAILGSSKTAEEFDHLSEEESKKRLRLLLLRMDYNGDQHLDRRELKAWILRSFKSLSEEEAQERFDSADENNDNKITWDEYKMEAYGSNEDDMSLDSAAALSEDKDMWKIADINNDSVLDITEWPAFAHPEEHPLMLPHILQRSLDDHDINKDGAIDFQEWIGVRVKEHDKEWLISEKDRFERDLDKNGDGKLIGNEILSWLVPSNDEIAEEEVEHLFTSSDDDQNGVLSFDEVVEHHDIFVGSEATDYGEHLQNVHHLDDEL